MDEPIFGIAVMQRRAQRDFIAGLAADECPFPWHSAAWVTWQAEFALLTKTTPLHRAPAAGQRVDAQQGAV